MDWVVERWSGGAGELHGREPERPERSVVLMDLLRPAVVLGSTQSPDAVDAAAVAGAGLEVARRRSGGGLVVLRPGEMAWVDVIIPAGDPLWNEDVGASFWWLGEAWVEALDVLAGGPGRSGAEIHRGPAVRADLGRLVCFAGLGQGEVSVGGRKLVGLSQRRTRHWARFQCVLHRVFDPELPVELLAGTASGGELGTSADVRAELGERLAAGVEVVDRPAMAVAALMDVLRSSSHDR